MGSVRTILRMAHHLAPHRSLAPRRRLVCGTVGRGLRCAPRGPLRPGAAAASPSRRADRSTRRCPPLHGGRGAGGRLCPSATHRGTAGVPAPHPGKALLATAGTGFRQGRRRVKRRGTTRAIAASPHRARRGTRLAVHGGRRSVPPPVETRGCPRAPLLSGRSVQPPRRTRPAASGGRPSGPPSTR